MSAENFSLVDLDKYDSGEIVDLIDYQLKAGHVLESGISGGVIGSMEIRKDGTTETGLANHSPGRNSSTDLDIPATFRAQRPISQQMAADQSPATLHILFEHADRHEGSIGIHSLTGLGRLTVALAAVTAERKKFQLNLTAVRSGYERLELFERHVDAQSVMYDLDSFINQPARPVVDETPLAQGLRLWQPQAETDAAIVVSDFIGGAVRNSDAKLESFTWEAGLSDAQLHMHDRLYAVRLATPSQTELPLAYTYNSQGRKLQNNGGSYAVLSEHYRAHGQEKAARITELLRGVRHLTLDTMQTAPLLDLTDFMFGTPDGA